MSPSQARIPRHKVLLFLLVGAVLLLWGILPVWAWEGSFFDFFEHITSARAAAMGGLHSALADDADTLFSNPAGLRSVDRQITVSEFMLSFYDSALAIAGETFSGSGGSSEYRYGIYSLWGPIGFSYLNKGGGFGIFSSSNIIMRTWGPIPAANETLEQNLVLIAAKAFRIPFPERWQSTLDIGLSIVGFMTAKGGSDTDIRQVLQSSGSFMDLLTDSSSAESAMGVGVEFGLLYSLKDWLAFGIAGRNLALEQIRTYGSIQDVISGGLSTARYNFLPLYLSAGILFRPPLGRLEWFLSDLLIAADYHNIFDFLIYPDGATNPLLHIAVGLEFKLLDIVSLRAGYYQCLPSFGLGLDLTLFTLDLAYFGREVSKEPGENPISCFTAGVKFSY